MALGGSVGFCEKPARRIYNFWTQIMPQQTQMKYNTSHSLFCSGRKWGHRKSFDCFVYRGFGSISYPENMKNIRGRRCLWESIMIHKTRPTSRDLRSLRSTWGLHGPVDRAASRGELGCPGEWHLFHGVRRSVRSSFHLRQGEGSAWSSEAGEQPAARI